jgi:hypothetical protein
MEARGKGFVSIVAHGITPIDVAVRGDRIGLKEGPSLHFSQRTEAGFDGLVRANLRFSEQGPALG